MRRIFDMKMIVYRDINLQIQKLTNQPVVDVLDVVIEVIPEFLVTSAVDFQMNFLEIDCEVNRVRCISKAKFLLFLHWFGFYWA